MRAVAQNHFDKGISPQMFILLALLWLNSPINSIGLTVPMEISPTHIQKSNSIEYAHLIYV